MVFSDPKRVLGQFFFGIETCFVAECYLGAETCGFSTKLVFLVGTILEVDCFGSKLFGFFGLYSSVPSYNDVLASDMSDFPFGECGLLFWARWSTLGRVMLCLLSVLCRLSIIVCTHDSMQSLHWRPPLFRLRRSLCLLPKMVQVRI